MRPDSDRTASRLRCVETNQAAAELYESLGLEVTGVRPRYYSDTREDALIMWGTLPAAGREESRSAPIP